MSDSQISLLSLVAKLYYLDGLAQSEVADITGVSRSKVSRLLTRARETGVVTITINNYSPRNMDLEEALKQRFSLRHAIVVKTFANGAVTNIRNTIGYIAAPIIAEEIQSNTVVGTAGGRTLHQLIRYLHPVREIMGVTVVQLMSNIGPRVGEIDAVELGRFLAQRFNSSFYAISAPIFAPDRETRDVFLRHEQVRTVWDLYARMDMAFVGIGTLENSAFITRSVLNPSEVQELRRQDVVGEICGRFYNEDGEECDTRYRDHVISIELDRLRQIPQVIGVTNGADRADAVCAALRGQILKSLIIDEAGAAAVLSTATEP